MNPDELIRKLKLSPLPQEGGYFRETYRSNGVIPKDILNVDKSRNFSTAIYYLITPESFSKLHQVLADEVYHFYTGDPVELIQIDENKKAQITLMGSDPMKDHSQQEVVLKKRWQGVRLVEGGSFALLGCTVSPGFEFDDFKIESREALLKRFPHLEKEILRYT